MRSPRLTVSIALATAASGVAAAQQTSYLPAGALEQFIVDEFDIRSINSSLNPRRKPEQSRFADLGLKVSGLTTGRVVLESDFETIVIGIVRRGDANRDGIEDVVICLSESAKEGSLRNSTSYVLQKYSQSTPLVALGNVVALPDCR